MNLKQFKLTNDDEIICEVLEIGEETGDIIIRKALKIMCAEDLENSLRYYSFRPFVSFSDVDDQIVVLNSGHIISEVNPTKRLAVHYAMALKEVERTHANVTDLDFDEFAAAAEVMDEDEFREYVKNLVAKETESMKMKDSADTNVMKFTPKGTLH